MERSISIRIPMTKTKERVLYLRDAGGQRPAAPLVSCERGEFLSLIMALLLSGVIEYRDLFGPSSATIPVNNK